MRYARTSLAHLSVSTGGDAFRSSPTPRLACCAGGFDCTVRPHSRADDDGLYRGLPRGTPYGATKAGLINLAETMRAELEPQGIIVRVINPGFVKTPLTEKNRFRMPALIEPEQAADRIMRKLDRRNFEITFPRRFTYVLKCLRCLPYALYFPLVRRLIGI